MPIESVYDCYFLVYSGEYVPIRAHFFPKQKELVYSPLHGVPPLCRPLIVRHPFVFVIEARPVSRPLSLLPRALRSRLPRAPRSQPCQRLKVASGLPDVRALNLSGPKSDIPASLSPGYL